MQTHSGTVPGLSRCTQLEYQQTSGGRSQKDPFSEVHFSFCWSRNWIVSEPQESSHIVIGVQEAIYCCSPGTSSGKQKKVPSTSQPQLRSKNTLATFGADHILLVSQHFASISNSVEFNINISRFSKLPKSVVKEMLTFDGKSEKNDLFEDPLWKNLKIHSQHTKEDKIHFLHSLMRGDALQTFKKFKNNSSPNWKYLCEILFVLRRKYVKPQPSATDKHKFEQLVFSR